MKHLHSYLLVSLLLLATACKKEEGEGGNSSIKGRVFVRDFNSDFSVLIGQYWAQNEDIYIIYGDNTAIGDNMETSYDGSFEFKYLRPGNYKVYVYSKDSTRNFVQYPSGNYAVVANVKINKKKEKVEIPTLLIYK